jgi:hypothetical protein
MWGQPPSAVHRAKLDRLLHAVYRIKAGWPLRSSALSRLKGFFPQAAKRYSGFPRGTCPLSPNHCPVPLTFKTCTAGVAESVTVTEEVRVPTALGVNVTVKVHFAFPASADAQGVAPPGTAA